MAEKHTNDLPQYYLIKDSKAQELMSKVTVGMVGNVTNIDYISTIPPKATGFDYSLTSTDYVGSPSTSIEYEVA